MKAILWFLFSGTAMASAFLLPIHFYSEWKGIPIQNTPLAKIYLGVLLFCAAYHGLYRAWTVLFDLGLLSREGDERDVTKQKSVQSHGSS